MKSNVIITYLLWLYGITLVIAIFIANFMFGPIDSDEFFNFFSFDYFWLPVLMGFFIGPFGCVIAFIILKIFNRWVVFSFWFSLFFALFVNVGLLYIANSVLVGG